MHTNQLTLEQITAIRASTIDGDGSKLSHSHFGAEVPGRCPVHWGAGRPHPLPPALPPLGHVQRALPHLCQRSWVSGIGWMNKLNCQTIADPIVARSYCLVETSLVWPTDAQAEELVGQWWWPGLVGEPGWNSADRLVV